MKDLTIFIFIVLYCNLEARLVTSYEDEGHPIVSGEEESHQCPPCHDVKINSYGDAKCVARPNCCLGHSSSQPSCLIDPCFYFKKACPRASICIPQNCHSSGCKALYYDSKFNLIKPADCHRYVFQRSSKLHNQNHPSNSKKPNKSFETFEKPPKIDIPSRLLQTSPNQIKFRESSKSKNKVNTFPAFFDFKGYEKPGSCPTHQKYLIQICTPECTTDSECQGRKKCCFNGCTRRCTTPMPKDDANFLNYPISGHWRRL